MSGLSLISRLRWPTAALLLPLAGCIESYMPDVAGAPASYLVVDGFINGNGRTRIKLSHSTNVGATTDPPAEKKAQLVVIDNTGGQYVLRESTTTPGTYVSDSLLLPVGRTYQLRITTVASPAQVATTYLSDPTLLKATPPIDRLGFSNDGTQVQVLLSTHDDQAQARYYRWGFIETYEFHSAYESFIEYRNNEIQYRITPIYTCWRTERSSRISQATTAQLSRDVVTDQSILSIPTRSERLKIRYSVLVSQYVQTPEEYAYNEILRKNTEAVGTVNDPLPSQLTGNVHRVGPRETVLGFVGAHTTQYQRLFIERAALNLPADWLFDSPYTDCTLGEELLCSQNGQCIPFPTTIAFKSPSNVPVDYIFDDNNQIIGYSGGNIRCVDCRQRGSNVKPSFW